MSPPLIWNPTSCTLQLTFNRPSGSTSSPLQSGCTYQGTSCIRYRRESLQVEEKEGTTTNTAASPSSEYADFLRHRHAIAQKNALHLHALTTAGGIYKDARPLQVSSYQVAAVSSASASANASSSGGGKSTTLKVLSVEQEDASASAAGAALTTAGSATDKKQKANKAKLAGKKNTSGVAAHAAGDTREITVDDSAVDWGSKLVYFDAADTLPLNSEVELTVHFTGTVQAFDHGGIYAARTETGDAPLLTHLEVRFARCAFPCPDDPQYRLDWHLKTLQLPDTYTTVLTNGEEVSRKALSAQHAVQLSFTPCGPLPAYVFSFACFAEPMDSVEAVMEIPELNGDVLGGLQGSRGVGGSSLSCVSVPIRVMARRVARIPAATLERVLRVTQEAIASLQHLFDCPLPLLRCRHIDVLLGPTMPFIAGMEHHCSMILNESIYQPNKKAAGGAIAAEVQQTELIIHELAHHWVGNALGLPFAVKEGICQVLEQCVGDTLLGKPMRKFRPDTTSTTTTTNLSNATSSGGGSAESGAGGSTTTIQASERGQEFTGTSYQLALSAIRRMVAESGFDTFASCLRHLVHEEVVVPTVAVEEQGGALMLRCIGEAVPPPPYVSTEAFLNVVESRG